MAAHAAGAQLHITPIRCFIWLDSAPASPPGTLGGLCHRWGRWATRAMCSLCSSLMRAERGWSDGHGGLDHGTMAARLPRGQFAPEIFRSVAPLNSDLGVCSERVLGFFKNILCFLFSSAFSQGHRLSQTFRAEAGERDAHSHPARVCSRGPRWSLLGRLPSWESC